MAEETRRQERLVMPLVNLLECRKNELFDGECHLKNDEADEIIAALAGVAVSAAAPALHSALVAMKIASCLPGVSSEYDFSEAIEDVELALSSRVCPMTVIDPDQWEPCSPEYLANGGCCNAVRIWDHVGGNHWHPKTSLFVCTPVITRNDSLKEA